MKEKPEVSTSEPYVTQGAGNAWSAEAASRGQTGSQRLLRVETITPTTAVRDAMELGPDDQVVVRSRLILADDQPVEIATSHYPAALAAGTPLAEPGKIRGGAVAVLAELGHTTVDVVEQVTARWPESDEAEILQVPPDEPLLVLTRTNHDGTGRPVECAVNLMVARRCPPIGYRMRTPGG